MVIPFNGGYSLDERYKELKRERMYESLCLQKASQRT